MASNKALASHLDATQAEISAFVARLQTWLAKNIRKVQSDLKSGDANDRARGLESANVLAGLESSLYDMGLEAEIQKLEKPFARQISFVADQLESSGVTDFYGAVDESVIEALVAPRMDAARLAVQAQIGDVRQVLVDSVLGIGSSDADRLISDQLDSFGTNFETELNTTLQGFSRELTATAADELGFELYEYIGPDDQVTRDFCEKLLGDDPPIFTRDEIANMDNGQGLDVMVYCGGWNCRHQWRPVSEERAREMGWNG